jgi:hypothetical protein
MWYMTLLDSWTFPSTPKPGQIWLAHGKQNLFVIHPDQTDTQDKVLRGDKKIRVLSDNSQLGGSYILFQDVNEKADVPKDLI